MNNSAFLTVAFKLRKPSATKRQILDYVMEEYTLAMDLLLKGAKNQEETIRRNGKYRLIDQKTGEVKKEGYTERSIITCLPLASQIEAGIASCLKEALVGNVAAMLAAYLEKDKRTGNENFPTCRNPSPDAWSNTLSDFCTIGNDLTLENEIRDRMLKLSRGDVMPLAYRRSRDFTLLQDLTGKRFFLFLKLLPVKSELAQKINIAQNNLVDINTGKRFKYRGKAGLLLPLEMGQKNGDWGWQYEKFIKPTLIGKAAFKTAKLVRKNGEYYFHISVEMEAPDPYEPETYLGVDRGVFYTIAWAVVDKKGRLLAAHHEQDGFRDERIMTGKKVQKRQRRGQPINIRHYRRQRLDEILHILANSLVETALQYKAMIVMEDLNIRVWGKFYKSAWQKLHSFVAHKCLLSGVPFKPDGVWAAYSSQVDPACGEITTGRKRDGKEPFRCRHCGFEMHADEAAAINIARRALYKKSEWGGSNGQAGDWRAFHRSFANVADSMAKYDLRNGGGME